VVSGEGLAAMDLDGTSDPYVSIIPIFDECMEDYFRKIKIVPAKIPDLIFDCRAKYFLMDMNQYRLSSSRT
jgi:hypothetical protein